ncbi:unnamed protein product [Ixodes hexagonus]
MHTFALTDFHKTINMQRCGPNLFTRVLRLLRQKQQSGWVSLRSLNAADYFSVLCSLCRRTARGTAPAIVATSTTVTVHLVVSHEDVESIKTMSLAASSAWARCMMGVMTRTAQQLLVSLRLTVTLVPGNC